MATLGNIIKVTQAQYNTLVNGGSISMGGVTYTYDANAIYLVDSGTEYVDTSNNQNIGGTKTFTDADGLITTNKLTISSTSAFGSPELQLLDSDGNSWYLYGSSSSVEADYELYLPNQSGTTLATTSDLNNYLPLSGGSITYTGNHGITVNANVGSQAHRKHHTYMDSDRFTIFYDDTSSVTTSYLKGGILLNETYNLNFPTLTANATIATTSDLTNVAYKNIDNNFPHTTFTGSLEVFSDGSSWCEGVRIHPATNGWSGIVLCESANSTGTGTSTKTWSMHNNEGAFGFYKNGSNTNATMYLTNQGGDWLLKGSTKTGTIAITDDITLTGASDNILDATVSSKTLTYAPYTSRGAGHLYTGTTNPSSSNRLNYDGYFYATKLYSGASEVRTVSTNDAIKMSYNTTTRMLTITKS